MYNQKKADDFVGKVLGDTAAVTVVALSSIGDRLGLWRDLAQHGAATPAELARRTGLSERHVREWCAAMNAAGYLELCSDSHRFGLPVEHVPVLAQESGPAFLGGVQQEVLGFLGPIERIIETFRTGGGVPQSAYPESAFDGMERFTAAWFENLLVPTWLPAVGADRRLQAGIDVADVGCGRGRALIKLAQTYPSSHFIGYDVYGPNIQRARENAVRAGVADRIEFVQLDVSQGLPRQFDLVTTFDVLHDAVDPVALMRSIRRSLKKDGSYLCLDINCSAHVEKNAGVVGAFMYGCSVLYCMSTSLAHGGAALGTCGLHEPKLRELADDVGFGKVERVPLENPFNSLYELRAE